MAEDNQQKPQQAPDASDDISDQVPLVPNENIKAPVKPGVSKPPTIPKQDDEEAQAAKDDILNAEKESK
jgi:hypothetical protein